MSEKRYKIIDINDGNVEDYDLFCHKSRKDREGYQNKLKWIKERFTEGLKFKLLMVDEGVFTSRGFVEYIPGEFAWRGVDAPDYLVIHCLWVVGKHKKKGYATILLDQCVEDAKSQGKHGVAVVAVEGNLLAGRKIYLKNGFTKVDETPAGFELYVKRFSDDSPLPTFNPKAKEGKKKPEKGFTVYTSPQCPYIVDFTPIINKVGKDMGVPVRIHPLKNSKEAQEIHPIGSFCLYLNGELVSHYPNTERGIKKQLVKLDIDVPDH